MNTCMWYIDISTCMYSFMLLSICLSIYMFLWNPLRCIHTYVCLSKCLFVHLYICLFVSMSVCSSVYMSVCLNVCLFICIYVCLSKCVFVLMYTCQFVVHKYVHTVCQFVHCLFIGLSFLVGFVLCVLIFHYYYI